MKKWAVYLMLVGLLALTSPAGGDTLEGTDAKGDTKGEPMQSAFDFRSHKVTHAGYEHGTVEIITHKVVSWKKAGYKSVVLDLQTGEDEWYATVRKKPRQKAAVYNYWTGKKIGPAKFEKLSDRSFSFTINVKLLFNSPERIGFRWRNIAKGHTDADPKSYDKMPNKGKFWHDL